MNIFELKSNLKQLYPSVHKKNLTSNQIVSKINDIIPFTECQVYGIKSISIDSNFFTVTGVYDPESDVQGLCPISLEIIFPKLKDRFLFDTDDFTVDHWNSLVYDLVIILGHEFVHLNQSRKRHFRPGKEYKSMNKNPILKLNQEYLGIPDEIDAYAFTAAAQMTYILPKEIKFQETDVYNWYLNVFKKNHSVLNTLESRTKKYYNRLRKQYNETYRKRVN